jgi:hypothetical protein
MGPLYFPRRTPPIFSDAGSERAGDTRDRTRQTPRRSGALPFRVHGSIWQHSQRRRCRPRSLTNTMRTGRGIGSPSIPPRPGSATSCSAGRWLNLLPKVVHPASCPGGGGRVADRPGSLPRKEAIHTFVVDHVEKMPIIKGGTGQSLDPTRRARWFRSVPHP